jgi:hypothetical protein
MIDLPDFQSEFRTPRITSFDTEGQSLVNVPRKCYFVEDWVIPAIFQTLVSLTCIISETFDSCRSHTEPIIYEFSGGLGNLTHLSVVYDVLPWWWAWCLSGEGSGIMSQTASKRRHGGRKETRNFDRIMQLWKVLKIENKTELLKSVNSNSGHIGGVAELVGTFRWRSGGRGFESGRRFGKET